MEEEQLTVWVNGDRIVLVGEHIPEFWRRYYACHTVDDWAELAAWVDFTGAPDAA